MLQTIWCMPFLSPFNNVINKWNYQTSFLKFTMMNMFLFFDICCRLRIMSMLVTILLHMTLRTTSVKWQQITTLIPLTFWTIAYTQVSSCRHQLLQCFVIFKSTYVHSTACIGLISLLLLTAFGIRPGGSPKIYQDIP